MQLRSLIFLMIALVFTVCPCFASSYIKPAPSFDQAADVALSERLYEDAIELYSKRIAEASFEKQTVYNQIGLRVGLAEALFWRNEFAPAAQQVKELMPLVAKLESSSDSADDYFVKQEDVVLISRVLDIKAWLEQRQGAPELALASLNKAISSLKSCGISDDGCRRLSYCRAHVASILAGLARIDEAAVALEDIVSSESLFGRLHEVEKSNVYKTLASLLLKSNQPAKAADYFGRAYKIDTGSELVNERYHPQIYLSETKPTFVEGAPWSSLKNLQKVQYKCLDLPLVSVKVSLVPKGHIVNVALEVTNNSSKNIEFLGRKPELIVVSSCSIYATLLEPINREEDGKAFWPQLKSDMVPIAYSNPPLNLYGLGAFAPPVVNYGGTIAGLSKCGENYNPHPEVDPTIAQRLVDQKKAQSTIGRSLAAKLCAQSLTPQDIPAGGTISGRLHFVSDCKTAKGYVLQLPIGQTVFVFPFESK